MAAWGDWETNVRGDELAIFSDAFSLVIVNEGSNPTFTGKGMGSIVDVTLSSESLVVSICHWTVESFKNNVSDHQTISFRVCNNVDRPTNILHCRKWNISQGMDRDVFVTGILLAQFINSNTDMLTDPTTISEGKVRLGDPGHTMFDCPCCSEERQRVTEVLVWLG